MFDLNAAEKEYLLLNSPLITYFLFEFYIFFKKFLH
jgi:hypothetical protein